MKNGGRLSKQWDEDCRSHFCRQSFNVRVRDNQRFVLQDFEALASELLAQNFTKLQRFQVRERGLAVRIVRFEAPAVFANKSERLINLASIFFFFFFFFFRKAQKRKTFLETCENVRIVQKPHQKRPSNVFLLPLAAQLEKLPHLFNRVVKRQKGNRQVRASPHHSTIVAQSKQPTPTRSSLILWSWTSDANSKMSIRQPGDALLVNKL
jgi:hypothetical protein